MKLMIEEKKYNKQRREKKESQEQSFSQKVAIFFHLEFVKCVLLKIGEKEIQRCVSDRQCTLSILKRDCCFVL